MAKMLPETKRTYHHHLFGKVTTCMADDGLEYFDMKTACKILHVTEDQALDLFTDAANPRRTLRDMSGPDDKDTAGVVNVPKPILRNAARNLFRRRMRVIAKKRRSAASKAR